MWETYEASFFLYSAGGVASYIGHMAIAIVTPRTSSAEPHGLGVVLVNTVVLAIVFLVLGELFVAADKMIAWLRSAK